jgi:hypothetical protein
MAMDQSLVRTSEAIAVATDLKNQIRAVKALEDLSDLEAPVEDLNLRDLKVRKIQITGLRAPVEDPIENPVENPVKDLTRDLKVPIEDPVVLKAQITDLMVLKVQIKNRRKIKDERVDRLEAKLPTWATSLEILAV